MRKKPVTLTFQERRIIQEWLEKGHLISEIARHLKRDYSTIHGEIKLREVNGVYNAQIAQEKMEKTKEIKYNNLRRNSKEGKLTLAERLTCLEEQVKILSETLMELMDKHNA